MNRRRLCGVLLPKWGTDLAVDSLICGYCLDPLFPHSDAIEPRIYVNTPPWMRGQQNSVKDYNELQ